MEGFWGSLVDGVWVSSFGAKEIKDLPPTLRDQSKRLVRRKDGQLDRRWAFNSNWVTTVNFIIQREYELGLSNGTHNLR